MIWVCIRLSANIKSAEDVFRILNDIIQSQMGNLIGEKDSKIYFHSKMLDERREFLK